MKIKDLTTCSLLRVLSAAAGALALCTSAAQAADYPTTVLGDNPSAYYRFEETNGTAASDSSTNGITATIFENGEGTSPVLGAPGLDSNSFNFIGPGPGGNSDLGYVDIPYSANVSPLNGTNAAPFSAELWVKPNAYPSDWSVPIVQGANNGGTIVDGWNVYVSGPGAGNPAGQSYFYLDMRPGIFQGYGDFLITFGAWYHLVLTYDGSQAVFYINGVAHTNAVGPGSFVPDPSEDALIASGAPIGWLPFNGNVDEVAFYTHVLTGSQVAAHYAIGTNSISAAPTPASILTPPTDETNYSGLPVTFSVGAIGSLPLTYTWTTNGAPVGGNNSSITFTAEYPGNNNASVQVVVSNKYGAPVTSSIVTLSVLTNLNILAGPSSPTRNVGSHAAFHVTANGAVPITYQWYASSNGGGSFTPISSASNPTATNQTLWLSDVQLAQSGNEYSVTVSNPFSSSSVLAALSVQPRQDPPVPLDGYGSIIAADNPVAYWRLDETSGPLAEDAVGTFDGTYTPGNTGTITYGAPSGVPGNQDTSVTLAAGATIQVPWAPELNPDTAWSVETWVQPASLGANGGDYRVVLSSQYNSYPFAYDGWYIYQQPSDTFAFVPQPGNAFIVGGPADPANNNLIVAGKWYHLVVTDDTTNFYMYINGQLITSYPVAGVFIPNGDGINSDGNAALPNGNDIGDDGGNFVIGQRTDAQFGTFLGSVDDTAVYQYALSPQQIKLHYVDATMLSITSAGSNVVLTWPVGTLQQAASVKGPFSTVTSATSPYTSAASGAAKYYRVIVP